MAYITYNGKYATIGGKYAILGEGAGGVGGTIEVAGGNGGDGGIRISW